jgi:hypothetical protein
MSSNLKIPRFATVVLVLGGACGNEEEDASTAGIDVGLDRQKAVAGAMCFQLRECSSHVDPDLDLKECAASYVEEFQEFGVEKGEDCLDAFLDYYECYNAIDCDLDAEEGIQRVEECEEVSAIVERCEIGEDEEDV